MLDSIRQYVARLVAPAEPHASEPGPSPASPHLSRDSVQVAAAALLLELAYADGEFAPEERAHIERAIGRHFGLDQSTAQELLELAELERREAVDDFQFTKLICEEYDLGQKMVLAEVMWGVVLADGTLGDHESYLMRKLGSLLALEPAYLAQARRAATPPS